MPSQTALALVLALIPASNQGVAQTAQPSVAASTASTPSQAASPADELLVLGFDAASAIPKQPHAKDRAASQEVIGTTAIEAGIPLRAMVVAKEMDSWRAGVVYGDLAIDAARQGRADSARTFARFALGSIGTAQDWQRDRVRVKVAQAYAWLGDDAGAADLEKGVGEPEQGKVRSARVARGTGADFDEQMASAETAVATKNFDLTLNALETCVQLARKSAGNEEHWRRIQALVDGSSEKITRDIQLRTYLRLADIRLEQGSVEQARKLIASAVALRDGARWLPDSALPLAADLARRMHAAGDTEAARRELDAALAEFESSKAKVADIFRAGALRPAAEALVAIGDPERARAVFRQAIEEGALNPNARPRAMDLAQTCASLARAGMAPDEAMWARLRALRAGLVAPW